VRQLAGVGVAAAAGGMSEALAQVLDSGIDPKSVLAKVKKGETLKIGFGQRPCGSTRTTKTNELRGRLQGALRHVGARPRNEGRIHRSS